ncbi:MAG: hypothetical protein A2406_02530 [Candidatus Komeilibacteria bacterium RIFOXYC1_FULL_37_11]|uniref:Histidine phosphatase family protein n=1 Tax=Candidatus Komeilibacteria bacterium RIFOXYC1_FULL_37_11 TaxID=1798555 RepID=A0A1G2C0E6_9BACT|nr:MAG: hypothetical protein A2406_02530 [Candidatus Komeilibacteria bacterium RIFOXYC1_FULL_37_11]OGY95470.1 MAG: hypothetical protein A2611_02095 [Candidatus Komeilibacteria bacterium RIFOXYD1_FULL_37_29]
MAKFVVKTLDLFRHSDKDKSGNHISHAGAELAYNTGDRLYNTSDTKISHGFHGPLIRTSETLAAMRMMSDPFQEMEIHDAVDGLGSAEFFQKTITDAMRADIKDGLSNMEAVLKHMDPSVFDQFKSDAQSALRKMFDLMNDGQIGVGIFHDPTIPMLAKSIGMTEARSLNSMEAIRFNLYDDGSIKAVWIEE